MAATLQQLHDGIKTNLATITGLRVLDITEQTTAPCVKVGLSNDEPVAYHQTMTPPGELTARFTVRCFASTSSPRSALTTIYGWLDAAGATSLRAAIESDTTLGGRIGNQGLMVRNPTAVGLIDDPSGVFFGADVPVEVLYRAT